jgi:hypothetical protein
MAARQDCELRKESDAIFQELKVPVARRTDPKPEPIPKKDPRRSVKSHFAAEKPVTDEIQSDVDPFDVFCSNIRFRKVRTPEIIVNPPPPPEPVKRVPQRARFTRNLRGAKEPPVVVVSHSSSEHLVFIDATKLGAREVIDLDNGDFMDYLGEENVPD